MNEKRHLSCCGTATARKPRVVIVGRLGSDELKERFGEQGWDVVSIPVAADLTAAVLARRPTAVVLPVETGWESGFLVVAKLRKARPKLRVVLVAAVRTAAAERFARFVGATLVTRQDEPGQWVAAVTD